jgi:hypothetical protein
MPTKQRPKREPVQPASSKPYRLRPFLAQFVGPGGSGDYAYAFAIRDVTKVCFDFVRNLLILGGIKYVSDKSGNPYLGYAYSILFTLLVAYAWSYILTWNFRFFIVLLPWKRFGNFLDFLINAVVGVSVLIFALQIIPAIADVISQFQTHH